jgi:hypothetical protein
MALLQARGDHVQKKVCMPASKTGPTSRADAGKWKKYQGRLDPRRLVFIDETWAKTNMTRRGGRSRRGTRLVAKVPHRRWRTLTFLAADSDDVGRAFRLMSATCSDRSRPAVPIDVGRGGGAPAGRM